MDEEADGSSAADTLLNNGKVANALALAGFVPIAILSVWLAAIALDHPWRADTIDCLKTYSAIILSFLAGIRWGFATTRNDDTTPRALILSVVPPMVAWGSLALPDLFSFAVLAAAFAAQGAWDQFAVHAGSAPSWFGKIRMRLSILVVAAMVLALVAVA